MSQSGSADQSVQQIQSSLQQQPELSGVMAKASGDKIELTGTVAKKADKDKAKSIAESAAGGKKVVDKIKVSGSSGSSASPSSDSTQNPPKS
jgi:osmotically-inducible protein OsmY